MGCADWAPNQRQIIIVHSHSQTRLSAACRQEAIRRCRARQGKATAQPRVRAAQDLRSRCGRGNIASTSGTADNRTPQSGTDARQQSSSAAPPISRDEEPDRHFRRLQSFLQGTPKILEVAVAPLGGENASLLVADYSGYNHYRSCGGVVGRKKGYKKTDEQMRNQYAEELHLLRKGYSLANVRKLTGTAVNTLRKVSKIGGITESRKKRMEMSI